MPGFYLAAIGVMLAIALVAVRLVGGSLRPMTRFADLFCMGVAFLLLETKNVVQFALLFGTTWLVNALVFAGVLGSVLLAVLVAKRIPVRRPGWLYAFLLVSIAISWMVPGHRLLALPFVPRLSAAVALAFLPIFAANLVFASRFRGTVDSTAAFGANLLGAMVGGMLEYASLAIGYRNLLLVVAGFYGLAFALRPREQVIRLRS